MEQLPKLFTKPDWESNRAKERKLLFERQSCYCHVPEKNLEHREVEKLERNLREIRRKDRAKVSQVQGLNT